MDAEPFRFSPLTPKIAWAAWDLLTYPWPAFFGWSAAVTYLPLPSVPTGALVIALVIWAVARCNRLALVVRPYEVVIHNKWRTVVVPWSSIERVERPNTWWLTSQAPLWSVRVKGRRYAVIIAVTFWITFDDPRLQFVLDATGQAPNEIPWT